MYHGKGGLSRASAPPVHALKKKTGGIATRFLSGTVGIKSAGGLLLPIVEDPHGLCIRQRLDQGKTILKAHAEQSRGQSIPIGGATRQDRDRGKALGGHEGIGVNDVVITLSIHQIVALVRAAGDQRLSCQTQLGQIRLLLVIGGVFNTHHPLVAVSLCADGTDVSAHV